MLGISNTRLGFRLKTKPWAKYNNIQEQVGVSNTLTICHLNHTNLYIILVPLSLIP